MEFICIFAFGINDSLLPYYTNNHHRFKTKPTNQLSSVNMNFQQSLLPSITLSELNFKVKEAILDADLAYLWVTAEISDFSDRRHCYMTLIEKDESCNTIASMRANIWANVAIKLKSKFLKATGKNLEDGMKVMICGSVTFHEVYGISFNITDIEPSYTLGDMERQKQEIIQKLKAEGIIDRNKEIPLPPNPQRIAVISSATADGYKDFVNQLDENRSHIKFYTHLFPAAMQGVDTARTIIAALNTISKHTDLFDCVAILRGGGSQTDLNWFDNYELARNVALFPLPVITGIGHQADVGVLDYVAACPVKTPTAVADLLIERCVEQLNNLNEMADEIVNSARNRMYRAKLHLGNLLPAMQHALMSRLSNERNKLDRTGLQISNIANSLIARESSRLDNLADKQRLLSPQSVLSRGYSLTLINGRVITDTSNIKPGDTITTRLKEGTLFSTVKQTENHK